MVRNNPKEKVPSEARQAPFLISPHPHFNCDLWSQRELAFVWLPAACISQELLMEPRETHAHTHLQSLRKDIATENKLTFHRYLFVFSSLDSPANCFYESDWDPETVLSYMKPHRRAAHWARRVKDDLERVLLLRPTSAERIPIGRDNRFIQVFLLETVLKFILSSTSLSTICTLILLCHFN